MPFVTEEIHRYLPGGEGLLATSSFPEADESLIDAEAENEVATVIAATQELRRYRDEVGAPAGTRIPARLVAETAESRDLYERSLPAIALLSRFELEVAEPDGALGEATIAVPGATVDVQVDADAARAARKEQVRKLREEIERAEGKLANEGFVEKAPADLVQQEREKLERYRRELADLEE